jgi:putative oxygen-independent coproporphyrinogen III oxidase
MLHIHHVKRASTMAPLEHLYIHWPFCKNKCHYCDFVALERHEQFMQSYHRALCNEILTYARTNLTQKPKIKTIFFGGGTPSLYPLPLLKELFEILHKVFDLESTQEISLEVNPGGITPEHIEIWKSLGINRLSVGVQVLNDAALAKLNRMQKNTDVYELMEYARGHFTSISADLILGLPDITEEIWQDTLNQVVQFPITHISTYLLTIHEKTPLYFKVKKGKVSLLDDDAMAQLYEQTVHFLDKHGFKQYEISNFAKTGFESLHNQAYWNRKSYKGFGIGAASYDGCIRTTNIRNLSLYLDAYEKEVQAHYDAHEVDVISDKQALIEELMLSLRQAKGMDLHRMIYLLGAHKKTELLSQINLLEKHDLARQDGGKILLTLRGMLLENEIVLSLL